MSQYFVQRGDKVHGPFSTEKVKSALQSGTILPTDLLATTKTGPWRSLRETFQPPAPSTPEISIFDEIDVSSSAAPVKEFQADPRAKLYQNPTSQVGETTSTRKKNNPTAAKTLLDEASKEIKQQRDAKPYSESVASNSFRYVVHGILALMLSCMCAVICSVLGFIPLGYLFKHFYDRDEDVIAYMYLSGGILASIGSVLIMGMMWQGSLEFGESLWNKAADDNSSFFSDGGDAKQNELDAAKNEIEMAKQMQRIAKEEEKKRIEEEKRLAAEREAKRIEEEEKRAAELKAKVELAEKLRGTWKRKANTNGSNKTSDSIKLTFNPNGHEGSYVRIFDGDKKPEEGQFSISHLRSELYRPCVLIIDFTLLPTNSNSETVLHAVANLEQTQVRRNRIRFELVNENELIECVFGTGEDYEIAYTRDVTQ